MKLDTIYNEDCQKTMGKMPDDFIDLVITSPPYDNLREYNGYSFYFKSIAKTLYDILKPGGVVVWIVGDQSLNWNESGNSFRQALFFQELGFNLVDTMIYSKPAANGARLNRHIYIQSFEYMFILAKGKPKTINLIQDRANLWANTKQAPRKLRDADGIAKPKKAKNSHVQPYGRRTNIWQHSTGLHQSSKDKIAFQHPAIFPEALAADHIKSWSNKGDVVYDPFMGSGTTAKMCLILRRKFIGSEISKEYCDIAEQRLNPHRNTLPL